MKCILAFVICCLLFLPVYAQDVTALIAEGEKQEAALNEKGALDKFQQAVKLQPSNVDVLVKCSELCSRIGNRELQLQNRLNYYSAAQTYASIALRLSPENSGANCTMAIAMGRLSLEKSGKERVKAAKEIKKYADLAVKYDPLNAKAWHVLGRWHYEISNLGVFEKAAVKVLFGGMPKSSFAQAVTAFEKAQAASPGFVINYLELAKAYKKNNQKQKAITALKTMLLLPDTTEDDAPAKKSAQKLLNDLE